MASLLAEVVALPVGTYFAIKSVASTKAAVSGSLLMLALGWGVVVFEGRRNRFEIEAAVSASGQSRFPAAYANWIDLGFWRRSVVSWQARRGRRHPDTVVAAVATDWANWTIKRNDRRRPRPLARRIVAVERADTVLWRPVYAPWSLRVVSAIVDFGWILGLALLSNSLGARTLAVCFDALAAAWGLWNSWLAGTTGQSIGKRVANTVLLTGGGHQLVGGPRALIRAVMHTVDLLPACSGFVAPLFDDERRTFADMLANTVVVMNPPGSVGWKDKSRNDS